MTDRFIEDKQNVFETEKGKFDLKTLLSGGFIKQRQKELFTIRCRVPAGRLDAKKMKKIAEVADKYGKGFVHLSFRQSAEIPYVNIKDFAAVAKELSEVGQTIASCGPRVRAITACGGCEYNPNGLTDTQGLAIEMDKRFFGTDTPHKFKISFSGCPIDCARTRENDLGFQGVVEPVWDDTLCDGCTLCAKACKEGAIIADKDGKPIFDPEKCIYCGDCIRVCPTESWKAKRYGHLVRVGGKHGRHPREADVVRIFISDEEVSSVIDKVVKWYQENGVKRERLGMTIERLGLEKFKEAVFGEKEVEVEVESRFAVREKRIADDMLDVVGLCCPMPLALTMERIKEMKNGEILAVLLDDEEAVLDIPKWCKKDGHRFLRLEKEENIYQLYIRKGGADEHSNKG